MEPEVVAPPPMTRDARDPCGAVVRPPLHLRDMRNRVRGPDVARIELHRPAALAFGAGVVTRLLEGVGVAAEDEAVAGHAGVPRREHARHGLAHPLALAEIREDELRDLE